MSSRRNPASSSRHGGEVPQHHQQMQVLKESVTEIGCSRSSTGDLMPFASSRSVSNDTNFDRFIKSISLIIPSRDSSEVTSSISNTLETDSHPFFCLENLWKSLKEGSMHGVGVPLLMNEKDPIVQYYVPYLSGIQLYKDDPSKPSSSLSSSRSPCFQYLEYEKPYNRQPLTDKIFDLASKYPELNKSKSCELLETSWLSVAWYPICRIPAGQAIETSFLSFYSLSTQSTRKFPPYLSTANARAAYNPTDQKFSLPVFGLLPYKLRESILSPRGQHGVEQENSLVQAADDLVGYLRIPLPDYQFFRPKHYSYRRS